MISGAVTEVCGSQMSFDVFDELQHSWHRVLAFPRLGESRFCWSWDKVWGLRFQVEIIWDLCEKALVNLM